MDAKKIAQGAMSALIFLAPVLTEPSLAWQQGKGEDRLPPAAIAPSSPSAAKAEASQSTNQARVVVKGGAPSAGSAGYFPNVTLLTQDNQPVRFYDDMLKGKVVVISFMFTTCNSLCPMTTAHLASVQEQLGERLGRDVFIISISVDPTNDTPAALKKFAESFQAKPGWYFLTGEKENVRMVRTKLGINGEDKMQHTGMVILGNEATGQWRKMPAWQNPIEITNAVKTLIPTKVTERN